MLFPAKFNLPVVMVNVPSPDKLPDIVKVFVVIANVGILVAAILIDTSETL